jgi:hypothetical protein
LFLAFFAQFFKIRIVRRNKTIACKGKETNQQKDKIFHDNIF